MTVFKLNKTDDGYLTSDGRFSVQHHKTPSGVNRFYAIDLQAQRAFVSHAFDPGSDAKLFDRLRDARGAIWEIYEYGKEQWA